ncbi:hypothetical protein [Flavobacterium haoranii]|uniref:hypothetical protein n=1 Tax=Flavobacterium haoranii TaxID=683124 RepID=UPI000934BB55|nr:hypothetical protein [Flavobacterium haoranii]
MNIELLRICYKITGFLPLIVFLFYYFKGGKIEKSIFNFLPFIVLMFFATFVECHFFKYSVKKWIRLYDFLEFYTLLWFFYKEIKLKKLYSFFSLSYLLLYIYLIITWDNTKIADQPLVIFTILLVLVSGILWFINVFKNFEETPLYKRTGFYIIGVILFYILSTSLSFLFTEYFWKNNRENAFILRNIILSFNTISRIIITVTLLKFLKFDKNESKF